MIWRWAGIAGVDPGPFKLRELMALAEGAWRKTACILAMEFNIHRGPDQSLVSPDRFGLFHREAARPKVKISQVAGMMAKIPNQ